MVNVFSSFGDKRSNFDAIANEINSKNKMKEIEEVIETKRKEIFDILSNSRANGNTDDDEKSLKNMQKILDDKKNKLEEDLGKMADLDILSNNNDIVNYCKNILNSPDKSKINTSLANECGLLLQNLQNVYTKGKTNEKLFSGKKDPADGTLKDLIDPDGFKSIMESLDVSSLQSNIDNFVNNVYSSKDNSFAITKSKLYTKPQEQAKVAARIAIFLHSIQKALNEGKIADTTKIKNILKSLKEEQIPKIRGIYNLKKEKEAVDVELDTLIDLRKNDIADIPRTDTTTNINLTDAFESKSVDKAKEIDFYNLNKENIKLNISGTEYTKDEIVLRDLSGEKTELNIDSGSPSGDFELYVKASGTEIKIGKINIDYTNKTEGLFTFVQDTNVMSNLTAAGITISGDIDLSVPIMAVKKVRPIKNTGQVSLTRNIVAKIKAGSVVPPPPPLEDLVIDATISDMGADVLKEKVAHNVEEELRKEYKEIAKGNVFKRAYFFLARGQMRNKRIKDEMKKISGKAFTGDTTIDTHTQNATDRHELEKATSLDDKIKNINESSNIIYQNSKIDDLCKRYIQSYGVTPMSDAQFQTEFNNILKSDTALKAELDKAKVTHMGTNILLKMKQKYERKDLVSQVSNNLENYDRTKANSYIDNINIAIQNYIKNYQDNSKELLNVYNDYLSDKTDTTKLDALKNYLNHQKSVMALTTNNIKIKLDIVKGGKSAYQIDNKDREKGWKYRLGHWMDRHPVWTTVGTVGASIGLGALTGGLGTMASAIFSTAGFAGIVGTTNAVKKRTHHTKEQNTHEKDLVTDHANEIRKVQERIDTMNNGKGWKKHKAKRQLELYHETTQSKIAITNILSDDITNISSKIGVLSSDDEKKLKYYLIEGRARLKYYREVGHNFLASNDRSKIEEDFNKLEKSIFLGINKLGATAPSDIESYSGENNMSQTVSFNDIYNEIKDDFEKTDKAFKKERRKLSAKYGVGTAGLSALTALGMQYITHSGVFAGKGTEAVAGYNSTNSISDNFELGKHELLDTGTRNEIYNGTKNALSGVPEGSTLNIHYGAGTDATGFINTPPTAEDLASKVKIVSDNIKGMSGLTDIDKGIFIKEVANLSGGQGTNGVLQNMRHAEFLEQAAQALSDSGQSGKMAVSLIHDSGLDVVGTTVHRAPDRVVNGMIEITKAEIPSKAPKTWGKRLMGMPTFFNTFKDREKPVA